MLIVAVLLLVSKLRRFRTSGKVVIVMKIIFSIIIARIMLEAAIEVHVLAVIIVITTTTVIPVMTMVIIMIIMIIKIIIMIMIIIETIMIIFEVIKE